MSVDYFVNILKVTVSLPASHVLALLTLLSLCLLTKYNKTGLFIAYLFAYRWGWDALEINTSGIMTSYLIFGVSVGFLAALGMLKSDN